MAEGLHVHHTNKRIAVLIAVLAAVLALAEAGGKNALHRTLARNIEASDLWSFFQAKTVRITVVRTAVELVESTIGATLAGDAKARMEKQLASWRESVARWDSEPDAQEGRKELMARARAAEAKRDEAEAAYHAYELSSGALQIAIVLASASVVTDVVLLAFGAAGLGIIGAAFALLGWFAPTLLHL
ncbi:MAG: DUF4337 family protein [Alphaproteobacteria bacterium]